ncbi:MAG: hypothetical protein GY852_00185, partial [bacterium]|nr:hypothetical protein [bacterium]
MDENGNIGKCKGAGSYDETVDIAGNIGGAVGDLSQEAEVLDALVKEKSFTQQMLETSKNLATHRSDIARLIRTLAQQVGMLSSLEEQQVSHFNTFINGKSVSEAASYSNLGEWNERYNFTSERYQKQLTRARVAAWVAKRAIEFRFGVNLVEETEQ